MTADVSIAAQMAALAFVVLAFLGGIAVLVVGQLLYARASRDRRRQVLEKRSRRMRVRRG